MMEHNNNPLQEARKEKFRANTGAVLRIVNMLRADYTAVRDIVVVMQTQHPDVVEGDVKDSLNFLLLDGYIELRYIRTGELVTRLAKVDIYALEAMLTPKGIRLLNGTIQDAMVKV